jgi:hypothetical protein
MGRVLDLKRHKRVTESETRVLGSIVGAGAEAIGDPMRQGRIVPSTSNRKWR